MYNPLHGALQARVNRSSGSLYKPVNGAADETELVASVWLSATSDLSSWLRGTSETWVGQALQV